MGTEPLPIMSDGGDNASLRKRRPPNANLIGWAFTCEDCGILSIDKSLEQYAKEHDNHGSTTPKQVVPDRCCLCAKDKYAWQKRKDLLKTLPERANGHRASLHTYTLGSALWVSPSVVDSEYYRLHKEMKQAFRKLIQSKWWKNRVSGMFYTIEVKRTETEDGRYKLHPHVHAIVLHDKPHDFKKAAQERGLGSYTYVRRIRGSLRRPINYILKYALKGYGDPLYKGRYYETTGVFRNKQGVKSGADLTEDAAASLVD